MSLNKSLISDCIRMQVIFLERKKLAQMISEVLPGSNIL